MAEAGEELSKVGTVIIEGWSRTEDPAVAKEEDGEPINLPTYDESREWYDVNRFVNPAPGHLPPFEVG